MKSVIVLIGFAGLVGVACADTVEAFDSPGWYNAGNAPNGAWYVVDDAGTSNATDGWTILGNTGTSGVDLVGGGFNVGAGVNDGQWIDLAGTPGPGGIQKAFTFTNSDYLLSFSAFSNDPNGSGIGSSTYGFTASLDGTVIHDYANGLTSLWTTYTLDLGTLSAGSHTLAFYTPAPNNGNVGFDTFRLRPAGTPEPVTTLFAGSMLAIALRKRLRTRKA